MRNGPQFDVKEILVTLLPHPVRVRNSTGDVNTRQFEERDAAQLLAERYRQGLMVSVKLYWSSIEHSASLRSQFVAFLQDYERTSRDFPVGKHKVPVSKKGTRFFPPTLLEWGGIPMALRCLKGLQGLANQNELSHYHVWWFYLQMSRIMYKHLNMPMEDQLLSWLALKLKQKIFLATSESEHVREVMLHLYCVSSVKDWAPGMKIVHLTLDDVEMLTLYKSYFKDHGLERESLEKNPSRLAHPLAVFDPERSLENLLPFTADLLDGGGIINKCENFLITYQRFVKQKRVDPKYFQGAVNELWYVYRQIFTYRPGPVSG